MIEQFSSVLLLSFSYQHQCLCLEFFHFLLLKWIVVFQILFGFNFFIEAKDDFLFKENSSSTSDFFWPSLTQNLLPKSESLREIIFWHWECYRKQFVDFWLPHQMSLGKGFFP